MSRVTPPIFAILLVCLVGCGRSVPTVRDIEESFVGYAKIHDQRSVSAHDFEFHKCREVSYRSAMECEFLYRLGGRTEVVRANFDHHLGIWRITDLESVASFQSLQR